MNRMGKQGARPTAGRRKARWFLAAGAVLVSLGLAEMFLGLLVPGLSIHRFDQNQQLYIDTGNEMYRRALMPSDTLFWTFKPGVIIDEKTSGYFPGRISNSLGLRNEECTREKPIGCFRILALGDSCTFGVGVPMEACYPRQLEAILNHARPDDGDRGSALAFQVLNAGVPGYSSFQGLHCFLEKGAALEPDLLLVCFGWNDAVVWDNRTDRFISGYLTGRGGGGLEGFLSRSAVYRVIKKALYSLKHSLEVGSRTSRVPVEEYIENMESILNEARARGMQALFLLWPMRDQVVSDESVLTPHQAALRRFCSDHGVPLVDLLEVCRGSGGASWFIDEGHLDAHGYRKVAESVAEALARDGLLPKEHAETGKGK